MRNRVYIKYIMQHKWYVILAGRRIGVPLRRLLVHDLSKFRLSEWKAYRNRFYAPDGSEWCNKTPEFDVAWLMHQRRNPHHWQYWVLVSDHGKLKPLVMPRKYVLEMVADWMGAGKAVTGKWDYQEWYRTNKEYMLLHPQTRELVEEILSGTCEE